MNGRITSIAIGLVLVLGVGAEVYYARQAELAPAPLTNPDIGNFNSGIPMSQVAIHSTAASCWSAVNGSVYDLTSWIRNHPGGSQAILMLCGINGSTLYNNQHGGESRPASILAGFKIGTLAK